MTVIEPPPPETAEQRVAVKTPVRATPAPGPAPVASSASLSAAASPVRDSQGRRVVPGPDGLCFVVDEKGNHLDVVDGPCGAAAPKPAPPPKKWKDPGAPAAAAETTVATVAQAPQAVPEPAPEPTPEPEPTAAPAPTPVVKISAVERKLLPSNLESLEAFLVEDKKAGTSDYRFILKFKNAVNVTGIETAVILRAKSIRARSLDFLDPGIPMDLDPVESPALTRKISFTVSTALAIDIPKVGQNISIQLQLGELTEAVFENKLAGIRRWEGK
jgi:hypothetical protein